MSEAYKIAIHLAMSSNHNAVLGALSSQLLGVHAKVNQLTGGFNRLKLAITGALSIGAGVTILSTMVKLVEKTKEYSHELFKLEALGGGMKEGILSGEIERKSFEIAAKNRLKVTEIFKLAGKLYPIFDEKEMMELLPKVATTARALQGQKDYKGDDASKGFSELLRAGDVMGQLMDPVTGKADPEQAAKFLDRSTRLFAATHGMVNPNTMLGMAKQGGVFLRGLTDEGFYTMGILAQAMGGPRAGTAELSAAQQLAGGTMLARSANAMNEYGLLGKDEYTVERGGHVQMKSEAGQRLGGMLMRDPLEFAAYAMKKLEEKGIKDPNDRLIAVLRMMGRQTSQRMTGEMMAAWQQIIAERGRMKQAYGAPQSVEGAAQKDVSENLSALSNAWDNLLYSFGGPQSHLIIAFLQELTAGLDSFAKTIRETDPRILEAIAGGIGFLGAALIGAGGLAIIAAIGTGGWLIAGVAALGAAMIYWQTAIKNFDQTQQSAAMEHDTLALMNAAWSWISRLPGQVVQLGNEISSAFNGIIDAIKSFLSRLNPFSGSPGAPPASPSERRGGRVLPGSTFDERFGFPTPQPQNFIGEPSSGPLLQKVNWQPPTKTQQPIYVTSKLNIDGRTMATSLADRIVEMLEFPTSAPYWDGKRGFSPPDSQTTST